MEILDEGAFFARITPKCVQVGPDTTREELLEAGMTESAVDEVMAYRDRLSCRPHPNSGGEGGEGE